MRFAFAHKLSTYLAVGSAFMAIALSGELNPLVTLVTFVAIVASWWWEPPRVSFDRWARFWTVMSIAAFVGSALFWLSGLGDILITGSHFLLYLLVAKLFSRRAAKDYQQVYVLTFLMLVSGTVLNPGFSFGVFFLGFVVFSTWALILFHLRREMEENFLLKHTARSSERVQVQRILNSKRIVGGRFFVGTSIMSLLVFVGATVLFLAIPRIGLGLFFPKRRHGVNLAGFSDSVKLGGHGTIKDDPTVVMRVYVDDAGYRGRGAPQIHWRGVAFDEYVAGEWGRSDDAPRALTDFEASDTTTWVHMRYDHPRDFFPDEKAARLHQGLRQEVYLEPMGTDVLFGASMPLVFEFESLDPQEHSGRNDELRKRHGAGVKYVVYSDVDRPPVVALRNAPQKLPRDESGHPAGLYDDVYLQGKDQMTDRVAQLARDITRNAPTWYDKAVAIEAYLRTEYDYTLEMVAPPDGQEPIDFFLFDRQKGHCEYFSSAMTMMLRTLDVPARNVNGFLGGAWNEYGDYIAVRGGDAHSWVEVYFPTVGWLTFDPTPSGDADVMGRGGTGLLDKLQRFMDTLRLKWFQWVIEYDLHQQLRLFKSLRGVFGGGKFRQGFTAAKAWVAEHKTATAVVVLSILAPILIVAWLRRRTRILDPLGGERLLSRAQSAIAAVYLQALHRFSRRGHRRSEAATPREYADQLRGRRVPGADDFSALTELYYRAIYGGDETPGALQRARNLRDAANDAWKNRKRTARAA